MLGFLLSLPILCLSQQAPVNTGTVLPRHGIDFLGPLWLPRQFKITCCRGGSPEAYNSKWISNWTQTVSDYAVDENAPLGQDDHCRVFEGSFLLSGSALVNFSFSAGGHGGVKCKCPDSPIALDKTCRQLPPCRNNGYRSLSMGGQCACNDPFFGELCEKNCDQGQILKSVDGRAYCSCTPFYQGDQCNEMVCLNGGVELNGRCSCPAPYLGYHCEVDQNRSSHTGSRFQRFGENSEVFSRDISGTVFSLVMIVVLVVSMYLLMKHRMQVQSRFASTRRDEMSRASAIYGLPPAQAHEARIAPFLAMGVEGPPPYAAREGSGRQRNEILPPLPTYEDATKDQPLRTWTAPEANNVPSSSNETSTGTIPLENCLPKSADRQAHADTHMTPGTVKVFVSESPVFCDPSSGKSCNTSSTKGSLRRIAGNIYEDETGFKQFEFVDAVFNRPVGDSAQVRENPDEKPSYRLTRGFICTLSIAIFVMLLLISLLLVFSGTDANPIQKEPRFEWPKPSDSVEKIFKKAAVTTDHGICSGIAGDVLKRGGNAIDASISVMFCLGATNPQSSGIGGGFLMTLYKKDEGKCYVIDARESAPAAATEDMYVGDPDSSKYGFKSAGTPGELAGYWYIFQHFGSGKVTWKSLIEPTIKLCRDGVPVSRYLDDVMKVKERHFRLFPSMKAWINPVTNATYKEGDLLPRVKLANTLELIADSEDPVQMFYHGDMAATMAKEIKEGGGIITAEDFANFKVRVEEGILINDHFRGDLVMCGGPAPSSFVVTQLIISVMSKLYPEGHDTDIYSDPKVMHHFVEAMKFAYAQRTLLGDHHFVGSARLLAQNMTTSAYTDWVLSRIKDTAQPDSYYGGIEQAQPADHGTSQITVLDEHGNAVSSTSTINRWFGAAVESEKFGIVWNDEMDDFSTPGTVNGFGFAPSETNFIRPGKRPMSSMSPMVIYNKVTKEPKLVGGASGGSKIISALAKAVVRSLIFGDTIKEAIDAPMYHNQFTPNIIQTDDHFPKELKSVLEWKYKQTFRNTTGFEGISQVIDVEQDGIHACGDFRRKTKQIPSGY